MDELIDGYKVGAYCKFFGAFAKIYTLSDESGNVFYVGCTTHNVLSRLAQHISEARSDKTGNRSKNDRIRSLNYKIVIQIVDMKWYTSNAFKHLCPMAKGLEKEWILKFHYMGYQLCNKAVLRKLFDKPKPIKKEYIGQSFVSSCSKDNGFLFTELKDSVLSEEKEPAAN